MIELKIPNEIFRGHIYELNEFFTHISRKNTRRIDLTVSIEKTSPPRGIEWHGEWYKVTVNGKEFIAHSDFYEGMQDEEILRYIDSLD
ncbi:MAG: hypothetical protein HDS89_02345 [Bacteroidales bacterium]|nr:hypothetical protein [Bacteroidales bacterium]